MSRSRAWLLTLPSVPCRSYRNFCTLQRMLRSRTVSRSASSMISYRPHYSPRPLPLPSSLLRMQLEELSLRNPQASSVRRATIIQATLLSHIPSPLRITHRIQTRTSQFLSFCCLFLRSYYRRATICLLSSRLLLSTQNSLCSHM